MLYTRRFLLKTKEISKQTAKLSYKFEYFLPYPETFLLLVLFLH